MLENLSFAPRDKRAKVILRNHDLATCVQDLAKTGDNILVLDFAEHKENRNDKEIENKDWNKPYGDTEISIVFDTYTSVASFESAIFEPKTYVLDIDVNIDLLILNTPIRKYSYQKDRELTRSKILLALSTAKEEEFPMVILRPFGCGDGHPPYDVANLFKEVIRLFSSITFVFSIEDPLTFKIFNYVFS